MEGNGPMVPNVWICLGKIEGYLNGDNTDKEDVLACIETMKKMFGQQVPRERGCPNGWPKDGRRAPGGQED